MVSKEWVKIDYFLALKEGYWVCKEYKRSFFLQRHKSAVAKDVTENAASKSSAGFQKGKDTEEI